MNHFLTTLKNLIHLKPDTDFKGTSDFIKANVEFRSANAWTLVFAMVIASVGLNVNSTAVIIGAMLISPLMGPIVGIGFALGTYDFDLLKKSSINLAVAVVISLLASMLYFLVSPLSEVQSELLARTKPSFFDVLIAFFGGAAGIVAMSRKEKGNAIPGVAIATALMPPLCTAGFGLATWNFHYFLGAMYLFIINSVFISISTFVFVRYLEFPEATHLNPALQKSINRKVAAVAFIVLVPSCFTAWYLQRESFFNLQVNKFIEAELPSDHFLISEKNIKYSFKNPTALITLLGDKLDAQEMQKIKENAKKYSLAPESIQIRQSEYSLNLDKKIGEGLSTIQDLSRRLQASLLLAETQLNDFKNLEILGQQVSQEMKVLFPRLLQVGLDKIPNGDLRVLVQWKSLPAEPELKKASLYLEKRLAVKNTQIAQFKKI